MRRYAGRYCWAVGDILGWDSFARTPSKRLLPGGSRRVCRLILRGYYMQVLDGTGLRRQVRADAEYFILGSVASE